MLRHDHLSVYHYIRLYKSVDDVLSDGHDIIAISSLDIDECLKDLKLGNSIDCLYAVDYFFLALQYLGQSTFINDL